MSIDAEISRLESLLDVAYSAYEEALRAQSYSLNAGGTSQSVSRQSVESLDRQIKSIKNQLAILYRKKSGGSAFVFHKIRVRS